jgi:tetratricopeptide (TPR) repeat protein
LKEIYSESELISLEEFTFNKTETNEFIKIRMNEFESNQIIESSPYHLNKMVAYKKLNDNSNLFDYNQDDLFNHLLIKNKTMWEFLQICSFFNSDYIPIKHTFVTILEIDKNIVNILIRKLINLSLIKVQIEKSSNGLKLNKRLKEEIKEFSKRKDNKNYTKLLDYCSEKIKKFKLTNFQSKNIYLNLKSFLETIAENYQITNNKNELFKWYFDFGVYNYELNILNDSLDYYKKALANVNDEYISADLMLRIGQLLEQLGSHKQALEYFIKSLEIYKKSNDLSIIVKLYDNIGKMYKNESEYSKALEYYNLSLNILSNHLDIIKTYNNISFIYRKKGQFNLALEYYTKSLNIILLESINDDSLVASLYNNIGSIYALKNEYDKSLEYFQKSLEIRKQILKPNHLDILGLFNNIGLIYQINDDYDKALEYYGLDLKISLESSLSLNYARIIELYDKIGEIYKHKSDHYKALDYFKQSLNLKEETLSNNLDICKSYIKIGSIYNDKFHYDKAFEYFSKSLDIQKQSFNADIAAETYCNLGVIYKSKGENKKAVEFFMKSLDARKKSVHSDHPEIKHLIDYNNYIILLLFFTNIKVPNFIK